MATAPIAPALNVSDVHASYDIKSVLRGVNLQVQPKETLAILGRSGCGKTTLLRGICRLVTLSSGQVALHGQRIIEGATCLFEEWEIRRHIMYVAQNSTLLPHLTVSRNISLPLEVVRGMSRKGAEGVAESAAADIGLDDGLLRRYPEELSGGEAQRAQLLRAMVLRPDVLLLDEVTANIDAETTNSVVDALWMVQRRADQKQAIIIVTHMVEFAERFADQIAFMTDGRIVEVGPAKAFRETARESATREFLAAVRGFQG